MVARWGRRPRRVAGTLLGVLAWCGLLGACSPPAAHTPAAAHDLSGLIRSASADPTVAPGGVERMSLSLLDEVLPLDLAVYVRYADGTKQEIDETANGSPVAIRWTVPKTVALGPAQARIVATRTCDCGSYPPHQGTALTMFSVAAARSGWGLAP